MTNPVKTDAEAFHRVSQRLQDDVGRLISASHAIAATHGTAPFWALARMLFPIVEAVGDLLVQSAQTSINLLKGIDALEDTRSGYQDKAAIIALLYRHSLMHADEMRVLQSAGRKVEWRLAFDEPAEHLRVEKLGPDRVRITVDLTTLYEDLLALCRLSSTKNLGGKAANRYDSWTILDLDTVSPSSTIKRAKQEIAQLI